MHGMQRGLPPPDKPDHERRRATTCNLGASTMTGKIFASLGAAGLLAACAGAGVTHSAYWSSFYAPNEAAAAFSSKVMPVTVRGNPFDRDPAALRDAVVDAMRATYSGRSAGFKASPGGTPDGYHMVARFDPERTQSRLDICDLRGGGNYDPDAGTYSGRYDGGDAARAVASASGRVAMQLAFCFDDEVVSTVSGYTAASGPDDPAIRQLIGGMWYDLLPPRDPKIDRDQPEFMP